MSKIAHVPGPLAVGFPKCYRRKTEPKGHFIYNNNKGKTEFHKYLKMQRKVALRLGELSSTGAWKIKTPATRKLLRKQINISDLSDMDVELDVKQKGVDMRIGLDIASLSLKGMVDQIILISGDGDFVPAAKLARREGIDFVLDPLWSTFISEGLYEHIDGLKSVVKRPRGYNNPLYGD